MRRFVVAVGVRGVEPEVRVAREIQVGRAGRELVHARLARHGIYAVGANVDRGGLVGLEVHRERKSGIEPARRIGRGGRGGRVRIQIFRDGSSDRVQRRRVAVGREDVEDQIVHSADEVVDLQGIRRGRHQRVEDHARTADHLRGVFAQGRHAVAVVVVERRLDTAVLLHERLVAGHGQRLACRLDVREFRQIPRGLVHHVRYHVPALADGQDELAVGPVPGVFFPLGLVQLDGALYRARDRARLGLRTVGDRNHLGRRVALAARRRVGHARLERHRNRSVLQMLAQHLFAGSTVTIRDLLDDVEQVRRERGVIIQQRQVRLRRSVVQQVAVRRGVGDQCQLLEVAVVAPDAEAAHETGARSRNDPDFRQAFRSLAAGERGHRTPSRMEPDLVAVDLV